MVAPDGPRVSVGVPVYNGERFLPATLDSIVAQTFTDFEIVLCDNASTDSTPSICQSYAHRDARVRYFRNDRNIGPAPNYNRSFELARGEFFKWNAADDLMGPEFLEKCVALLDADPTLIGAYPRTKRINAQDEVFGEYAVELDHLSESPARRFGQYIFTSHKRHHAAELWALVRADVLRRWSPLKGSYPSADRVYLATLLLHGKLGRVEEYLHFDRDHSNRSEQAFDRSAVRSGSHVAKWIGCGPLPPYAWWDSTKKGKIVFPEWRWWGGYVTAVRQSGLPVHHELQCMAVIAALTIKFAPRLARDLLIAAEQAVRAGIGLLASQPAALHRT